jgi:uncharacterized protein (DUF433 family)
MERSQWITADPHVMTGMPCIRGTRITVANLVRQVASGRSTEEVCGYYPALTPEAVRAALEFAAELSSQETHEIAS